MTRALSDRKDIRQKKIKRKVPGLQVITPIRDKAKARLLHHSEWALRATCVECGRGAKASRRESVGGRARHSGTSLQDSRPDEQANLGAIIEADFLNLKPVYSSSRP